MKEIIFTGRSNVGKSTLIKALTGKNVRIGKRPGVTRKPLRIPYQGIEITDMPGYGFMSGASEESQEAIKDNIVHYIEDNAKNILCAVMVIDAKSFSQIIDRWTERNEIPVDIELYEFLNDVDIDVIVAVNKIDKIENIDETFDGIAQRLGMMPPWRQWIDILAPVCAKKGELGNLKAMMRERIIQ